MSGYLFIFGNSPSFSQAELSVFFPNHQLISPDVVYVEGNLDPVEWMKRLGGTVKIAKVLTELSPLDPTSISEQLQKISSRRLSFGISSYSKKFRVQTAFLQEVKDELTARGISTRFVAPKDGNVLSSVVVAKQELTEFVVVYKEDGWLIGQTVAVQDFEEWNRRDYRRPAADPKAGMLPPKVARMAVNLGESKVKSEKSKVLLDPFCGVGTILGEALLSGWNVIGSDQSEEAIEKTRKNLDWLKTQGNWNLFVSDATHISEKLLSASIDAIVTEPFMGAVLGGNDQSTMTNIQVKNIIKGLEKLYIGCLKDWKKILVPGGKMVIALPEYAVSSKTFFVKKVIDICETLGYTLLAGPIAYSRPQAVVRRKFFVFRKN